MGARGGAYRHPSHAGSGLGHCRPEGQSLQAGMPGRAAGQRAAVTAAGHALRRENVRLRDERAEPKEAQLRANLALLKSENSNLRSQNLSLAARLHVAEKKLEEQGTAAR